MYLGQEPSVGGYELLTITGTINGSNTSFTLSKAPASANHLMLIINGVLQIWSGANNGYSLSGTTLTTTSAPATGSTMAALMLGSVYDVGKPTDGSVVAASIGNDQIDSQHYVDGSIDSAHIGNDQIDSQHYAAGSIDLEHMSSQSVDEDNLHISNAGSNGEFLQKQSGNAGGLTWAAASASMTPAFHAYRASGTQSIANNTLTILAYSTEVIDTDNAYDTSTYRFTPQTAGKYLVCVAWAANGSAVKIEAIIAKNGSQDYKGLYDGGGHRNASVVSIIDMNGSSDYIQPMCHQQQGSAMNTSDNWRTNYMWAFRLPGV